MTATVSRLPAKTPDPDFAALAAYYKTVLPAADPAASWFGLTPAQGREVLEVLEAARAAEQAPPSPFWSRWLTDAQASDAEAVLKAARQ